MADLWSTKHEEALQRLYSTLCAAVGEVDTRIQFEEALKRLGWPLEPPGLMDPPWAGSAKDLHLPPQSQDHEEGHP